MVGRRLFAGSVFDSPESFSLASILTPEVIAALAGLSVLSLMPVVYKKLRARGYRTRKNE